MATLFKGLFGTGGNDKNAAKKAYEPPKAGAASNGAAGRPAGGAQSPSQQGIRSQTQQSPKTTQTGAQQSSPAAKAQAEKELAQKAAAAVASSSSLTRSDSKTMGSNSKDTQSQKEPESPAAAAAPAMPAFAGMNWRVSEEQADNQQPVADQADSPDSLMNFLNKNSANRSDTAAVADDGPSQFDFITKPQSAATATEQPKQTAVSSIGSQQQMTGISGRVSLPSSVSKPSVAAESPDDAAKRQVKRRQRKTPIVGYARNMSMGDDDGVDEQSYSSVTSETTSSASVPSAAQQQSVSAPLTKASLDAASQNNNDSKVHARTASTTSSLSTESSLSTASSSVGAAATPKPAAVRTSAESGEISPIAKQPSPVASQAQVKPVAATAKPATAPVPKQPQPAQKPAAANAQKPPAAATQKQQPAVKLATNGATVAAAKKPAQESDEDEDDESGSEYETGSSDEDDDESGSDDDDSSGDERQAPVASAAPVRRAGTQSSGTVVTSSSTSKAPKPSEEDEWKRLQAEMNDIFTKIVQQCSTVSMDKQDIYSKKRRNEERVKQLSQEIETIERKIQEAMDREDFEAADQLQTKIDAAQTNLDKANKKQEELEKQLAELEKKRVALPKLIAEKSDSYKEKLELLFMKNRQEFKDFIREARLRVNYNLERIKAEEDRLEREQNYVKLDMERLDQRRQRLQGKIGESTVDLRRERDQHADRLTRLEVEIQELKRQLALKEQEADRARKSVQKAEKQISKIRNKFESELKELAAEEEKYGKKLAAFQAEQERFGQDKQRVEREKTDFLSKRDSQRKQLMYLKENIHISRRCILLIDAHRKYASLSSPQIRTKSSSSGNEELERLQLDQQKALLDLQDREKRLSELKESNGQLKQRLQDASENLMPQLEREKQQAAKSRNFKEAAQIKDQISKLSEKQEQWRAQLERQMTEVEQVQEELEERTELERKLSERIRAILAELHMSELKSLIKERYRLERMLDAVEHYRESTETVEGISAALRAMQQSLAQMVRVQKEAIQLELDELIKKIGGMKDETIRAMSSEIVDELKPIFDEMHTQLEQQARAELDQYSIGDEGMQVIGEEGGDDVESDTEDAVSSVQEAPVGEGNKPAVQEEEEEEPEEYEAIDRMPDESEEPVALPIPAVETVEELQEEQLPRQEEEEEEPVDIDAMGQADEEEARQALRALAEARSEMDRIEKEIEAAAEAEDYDRCSELDDVLQQVKERIKALQVRVGDAPIAQAVPVPIQVEEAEQVDAVEKQYAPMAEDVQEQHHEEQEEAEPEQLQVAEEPEQQEDASEHPVHEEEDVIQHQEPIADHAEEDMEEDAYAPMDAVEEEPEEPGPTAESSEPEAATVVESAADDDADAAPSSSFDFINSSTEQPTGEEPLQVEAEPDAADEETTGPSAFEFIASQEVPMAVESVPDHVDAAPEEPSSEFSFLNSSSEPAESVAAEVTQPQSSQQETPAPEAPEDTSQKSEFEFI